MNRPDLSIRRWTKARPAHLAALAAVVIVMGTLTTPVTATSTVASTRASLDLRSCLLTGVNFPDSADRLTAEGWVPEAYPQLPSSPGDATVMVWTFACSSAEIADQDVGATSLSIVGAGIQYADKTDLSTWPNLLVPLDWAANWGVYVVRIDADNAEVVAWLRAAGLPAEHTTELTFTEEHVIPPPDDHHVDTGVPDTCASLAGGPGAGHSAPATIQAPEPNKTTVVSVAAATTSYETATAPLGHHNAVTHCHDQLLWSGPYEDGAKVRLVIPVARDHFCDASTPGCGSASGSGQVGEFLGGSRSDPVLGFDHEVIPVVHLTALTG